MSSHRLYKCSIDSFGSGEGRRRRELREGSKAAKDRYWKIPICYDDDDDYTIAITPVLPTKEPVNSLSMGDEHLDTILATESDEVIKSSVENLVSIPSEPEGRFLDNVVRWVEIVFLEGVGWECPVEEGGLLLGQTIPRRAQQTEGAACVWSGLAWGYWADRGGCGLVVWLVFCFCGGGWAVFWVWEGESGEGVWVVAIGVSELSLRAVLWIKIGYPGKARGRVEVGGVVKRACGHLRQGWGGRREAFGCHGARAKGSWRAAGEWGIGEVPEDAVGGSVVVGGVGGGGEGLGSWGCPGAADFVLCSKKVVVELSGEFPVVALTAVSRALKMSPRGGVPPSRRGARGDRGE
ncbi:hypothetical protein Tco_0357433, partial [Tanacetum coccineum]